MLKRDNECVGCQEEGFRGLQVTSQELVLSYEPA